MRPLAALALIPCFAACHEPGCPDPTEVAVVAASDAPASALAEVRDAITTFARWTDDSGVCVDAVYLGDDMPDPDAHDGMVDDQGAWVRRSDAGTDTTVHERTIHQLCHAADQALALSDEGGFADEEAFATACTLGPKSAETKAYAVCDAGEAGAKLLLDQLFVGEWPQRIEEGAWSYDVSATTVHDVDGTVVPAADGAAVLEWSLDGSGARPWVRLVQDEGPSAPIAGPTLDPKSDWQLLGGGGAAPILVVRDHEGTRAVRYDFDQGQAVPVPVPVDLAIDEAVVTPEALWAVGSVAGSWGAYRIDLTTGEVSDWSTPKVVERPMASHGRIAMPDGHDVLVFDVATTTWTAWPLPLGLTALEAMPDAVGSLSVRWSDGAARGLARLSAPLGTVQLDVEACSDPIAADVRGSWAAGAQDATWSTPDAVTARLDVHRLDFSGG